MNRLILKMIGESNFTTASDGQKSGQWANRYFLLNGETVFEGQRNNDGVYVSVQVKQGDVTRNLNNAELRSLSSWVSCMNKQLSNMGLASWIIGVVTVGCAAICVVTAETGCWACLGVAAIGYGAEIGYALAHC